jgi:hypothetical protein
MRRDLPVDPALYPAYGEAGVGESDILLQVCPVVLGIANDREMNPLRPV